MILPERAASNVEILIGMMVGSLTGSTTVTLGKGTFGVRPRTNKRRTGWGKKNLLRHIATSAELQGDHGSS